MSKPAKNKKNSNADRLENLEEAIRGLGSEIAGEVIKALEESIQKKMSQVEQSVASLQEEVKSKYTPTIALSEAMPIKKIIKFSFSLERISTLSHLESPEEEIGGAKWSIFVFLDEHSSLSVYLRCYFQDQVVSHDTSFTIRFQGLRKNYREDVFTIGFRGASKNRRREVNESELIADEDYSKEFTHRFKKIAQNYDQCGYDGVMSYDHLNNYKYEGYTFETEIDLTILQNTTTKHPQEVVDEFCAPASFSSDCVLIVEGKKIYVNKGLLSVHSKVFNTLFNGNFAEKDRSEISMEDLDAGEFCQLLQVIYPNKYREIITVGNVGCVLKMADRFDVGAVLDKCEQFLLDSPLCFTNAKKMLIAQKYGFTKLMTFCVAQYKSVEHLKELIKEPEYSALNDKTVRMVFDNIGRC